MSQDFVINTISIDTDLGGLVYPFLLQHAGWEIRSWSVKSEDPHTDVDVTLRWVKDDKVNDLIVPNVSTADFLDQIGLRLNVSRKGPFVLSKRISRVMRPFRYFRFYYPDSDSSHHVMPCTAMTRNSGVWESLVIKWNPNLDEASWDGCALITRGAVRQMALNLTDDDDAYLRELETCKRFELTVVHPHGQEKSHAFVVERDEAIITLPANSTKRELTANPVFVGLQPVHSRDDMRLDVQSLINLHDFFPNESLLAWMRQESELFLNRIRSGQFDALLSKIGGINSADGLANFSRWHIGEYLMSGGILMWFPGAVKAMTNQFLRRLRHGETNFRFPVPGGRYYIFPNQVGNKNVAPGHILLDRDAGTAWVNVDDWNEYIVNVLGGCDGDDALWIVPFTDFDGSRKVLAWRSPNQFGEYVLLAPMAESDTIVWETAHGSVTWPRMDSRNLPPRIDTMDYVYGELEPFAQEHPAAYSIAAMQTAIMNARANGGVLGAYVNALMVLTHVFGNVPTELPARLEDVIDGSVKSPVNLAPVLDWIALTMREIAAERREISEYVVDRIAPSLSEDDQYTLLFDPRHWLTNLMRATDDHIHAYLADAEALMVECEPPAEIFAAGRDWQQAGAGLCTAFQKPLQERRGLEAASRSAIDFVTGLHTAEVMLGAAAYIYTNDLRDSVLWQLDLDDGTPGMARRWLAALRHIGLIGEPVWTELGVMRYYEERETATPLQVNGTWFNYLNTLREKAGQERYTTMKQTLIQERNAAKSKIAEFAKAGKFEGMVLNALVTNDDRIALYGPQGNLIGFVAKGQELRAAKSQQWQVRQAFAKDGNLHLIAQAI